MSQEQEREHQKNLAQVQKADSANNPEGEENTKQANTSRQSAKSDSATSNMAKNASPTSAKSLRHLIKFSDVFFFLAIMLAGLKDSLDWVGIGSLPVIGTLITILVSIVIFFATIYCGSHTSIGSKNKIKLKTIKWLILAGGTGTEMFLFGINFAPIETTTACTTYVMILLERKDEFDAKRGK